MSLRSKVLSCYRKLHRARLKTFQGDTLALEAGRQKIREEFAKNKNEADKTKIAELILTAEDVERMLRQNVVQAILQEKDKYKAKITEDTQLLDNATRPKK
ncbi:predicted protein [Nematostella vectensis]|uniref:Complex III assembly factor LYRM7 n=1 Tax=Nematostella vectensis TaxID=45351 RepID=A7SW55_NEMVE|nr:predicted protein [Nematostella vectensis]|eukprot:XP_001624169.1 predicted protein [Nematostella vectensis]